MEILRGVYPEYTFFDRLRMSGRKRLTKNSEGLGFFDRLRMSEGDRMTQNGGFAIMRMEIKYGEASAPPQPNVLPRLERTSQQIVECTQPDNQRYKHITT